MGEKDLITPVGTVRGTSITIYESSFPQPGTVLLVPWPLLDLPTSSRTERAKRRGSEEDQGGGKIKLGERHGWMLRALGPDMEARLSKDHSTLAKISLLYGRLGPNQKTWLEPELQAGDPYRSPIPRIYVPWVAEDCLPWIVFEGSKMGLNFAASRREYGGMASSGYLIGLLERAVANPENYECQVSPPRGAGIRLSSKKLGLVDLQAISMGAGDLYSAFASTMKSTSDRRGVAEAYQRILMYRFLKRRRLTPPARVTRASDPMSDAIERRANLLQAHRLFVFNGKGCPVSLNENTLVWNGLDTDRLLHLKTSYPAGALDKWVTWLYSDVLEKPTSECVRIRGLEGLAASGYLG